MGPDKKKIEALEKKMAELGIYQGLGQGRAKGE